MATQPWRNRIVRTGMAPVDEIQFNAKNWRIHPKPQQDALAGVISEVGVVQQVLINDRTGNLIDGHLRVTLADRKGEQTVPAVWVDLDEAEEALVLATLDPLSAMAATDAEQLDALLQEVSTGDAAVQAMLADLAESAGVTDGLGEMGPPATDTEAQPRPSLSDRFLVPPFSVLDARQGYWQERKRAWLALGIESELGRGENALGFSEGVNARHDAGDGPYAKRANAEPGGSRRDAASLGPDGKTVRGDGKGRPASGLAQMSGQDLMRGEHVVGQARKDADARSNLNGASPLPTRATETGTANMATGTSIFDPVLCELAYTWFCPPAGAVLDPFAGGSVRGVVASRLGRRYTGIDLRPEQIAANEEQASRIAPEAWLVGDSQDIATLAPGTYDLLFSCPPYADLERYSDDPRDISTMDYPAFLAAYRAIVAASVALLRPDRFACFVVGDVRDRKGLYRGFVPDTIAAFRDAGAALYNEAILVTSVGSLPIRVGKQFESGRKLGKTHQNVLVFVKGDPRKATEACGPVVVSLPDELAAAWDDARAS
jgi:ParB-like chromosome segregation protein Spo0J